MNAPATIPPPWLVNLPPVNLTAELQKAALSHQMTVDQHADLRTLILDAAAAIGFDGNGRDGLLGYLKYAASTFPKQYLQVIAKVLPLQIDAKSNVTVIGEVNIVSVPKDRYIPPEGFAPVTEAEIVRADVPNLELDDSVVTIEDMLKNPVPVDPFASGDET